MTKPIQLALPVMLHREAEITAFNDARARIEKIGSETGVPVEVGAFLLYLPKSSRTPEAFSQQLGNQEKHRLPIRLVETGVQRQNALSYGLTDPTFNPAITSDLEATLEQAARLRDLDPTAPGELVVAPHVGILVIDDIAEGDFSKPGFYSPADFKRLRRDLIDRSRERFEQLDKLGSSNGLKLALENTFAAVYENRGFWQAEQQGHYGFDYQAFNDFPNLRDISGKSLVLDLAHFSAMRNIPARFRRNRENKDTLFSTLDITSWSQFPSKEGRLVDYLTNAQAFHLSPTDGIGIRVPEHSEDGRKWGDGTGKDLSTKAEYNACLRAAQEKGMPVAIEVDYNTQKLDFREADPFVGKLLSDYKSTS